MSLDVIKFAFVAGEISDNLHFRSDLEKFDLALASCENWFVDYRGGLSTRPGTEFIDYIEADDKDVILIPFKFSSNIENTNEVLFGDGYLRIIQDGAYVLHDPFSVTNVTLASSLIVTVPGNDFAVGDWIKLYDIVGTTELNNDTFVVRVAGDDLELEDTYGNTIDSTNFTAYVSGGSAAGIVRVTSPYAAEDLAKLKFHQRRDVIRLTHVDYPVYNLRRLTASSWELTEEAFTRVLERPTGLSAAISGTAASFGCIYQVVAVDDDGNESLPSNPLLVLTANNPVTTNGWTITVSWTAVTDARYYKVFRSRIVLDPDTLNAGMEVGYIGKTFGTTFNDQFIQPDYTITPPRNNNPFANGAITRVDVTAGGDGYTAGAVLEATDANPEATGFLGLCIIDTLPTDASRPIVGVIILSGGKNYTNPIFSVTNGGAGTGATFAATLSPQTGNYPAVGVIFQQRQLYAGAINNPLGLEGSRPKLLDNFDVSDVVISSDAYGYEIDAEDASPIDHMLDTRGGLLVFTRSGIWQFAASGGSSVTPSNALAEPQTYKGATNLTPIKIDTAILYAETGAVKFLSYNDTNKIYSGTDLTLLANHLVRVNNQLTRWCYADEPFKLVKAVREDGTLLTLSLLREEAVFAWTRYTTRGKFLEVSSLQEDATSTVYTIVERPVGNTVRKYLEKFNDRQFTNIEDAWTLDAALALGATYPAGSLTFSALSGDNVTVTCTSAVFTAGDVNSILRAGGGKAVVKEFVNPTTLLVKLIRPVTKVYPQTSPAIALPIESGMWTLDAPQSVLSGFRHLEGETVTAFIDGTVYKGLTVTGGKITLPVAGTRVVIGFPFTCEALTLPPVINSESIEGKRKRIIGVVSRIKDTRGLKIGTDRNRLRAPKERVAEAYGEPVSLQAGIRHDLTEGFWHETSAVYFVQEDSYPSTILGYVAQIEVGDDKD